jgi:hypothetical protein
MPERKSVAMMAMMMGRERVAAEMVVMMCTMMVCVMMRGRECGSRPRCQGGKCRQRQNRAQHSNLQI